MGCRVPQKRYQSLNDFCGALKDGMALSGSIRRARLLLSQGANCQNIRQ